MAEAGTLRCSVLAEGKEHPLTCTAPSPFYRSQIITTAPSCVYYFQPIVSIINPRMIIDFHTHIFPPPFRELREEYTRQDKTFADLFSSPHSQLVTAEELVTAMDEAQVDVSVVMGVGWTDKGVAMEANDYIIQSVKRFPTRLVGFCSVNPAWGDDALQEVERCVAEGLKGIGELHPDTQGFDIGNGDVLAPLMELARRLGLVVLTHSSEPVGHLYPGKGMTAPDKLYAFIRNFLENTIVCAHWGGGLPFYTLMPEVTEALRNVYYDTAASPLLYRQEIFSTVVGLAGADRILFGTDFPLIRHSRLLRQVEEVPITHEARADILGGNAQKLLGNL